MPKWAFSFHASSIAVIQVNNLVADGNSGFRYPKNFIFQAGQPSEITQAYRDAMGMNPDGTPRLSEVTSRA